MPVEFKYWFNVLFWDSGFGIAWLVIAALCVLGFYVTRR